MTALPSIPADILGDPNDMPDLEAIVDDMTGEHLRLVHSDDEPAGDQAADEPEARWTIRSLRAAEWAMAKVKAARDQVTEREELAQEYHRQIDGWLATANRRDHSTILYLGGLLQDYALERRDADETTATLVLPSGKVRTTRSKPAVKVAEGSGALAVAFARRWGAAAVTVKYAVAIKPLRQRLQVVDEHVADPEGNATGEILYRVVDTDGEVVDLAAAGLEVEPGTVTAKVEPS